MKYLHLFFITFFTNSFSANALTNTPQEHCPMTANSSYDILGIGASITDILIQVDENFLSEIPGEKGGCLSVSIEALDDMLSKTGKTPKIATGGSSANTIKGLACLGTTCAFLSHVGTDHFGEHFDHYMKQLGVVPLFSKSKLPSPRVLCLITPDGQRTMRSFQGSTEEMSQHHLQLNYFKGVKIVHLDAYTLRNENLTKVAMQIAKEAGAKISFDLSSFEIVRKYKHTILELLRDYVDIVFANEDETLALTGSSPLEGCGQLQKLCPIAVVLKGSEGCIVASQGEIFSCPTFTAQVVDSTGAGDLFASGFLYGYLNHYSLVECALLGNRLGSAIVEVEGAELPEETWNAIQIEINKDFSHKPL